MIKWEYKYLAGRLDKIDKESFEGGVIKEFKKKERPVLIQRLNQLGSEGWELVSVEDYATRVFLKRPLQ